MITDHLDSSPAVTATRTSGTCSALKTYSHDKLVDLCLFRTVTELLGPNAVLPFAIRRMIHDFCIERITHANVRAAVRQWIDDTAAAVTRFGPIGDWDVSGITNMDRLFQGRSSFNEDISRWDVSNVTSMKAMFYNCSFFNQPLSGWDVSRVTDMGGMFHRASLFNQSLSTWNVGEVVDMNAMFYGSSSFNQPLVMWDVSQVMNMSYMFYNAAVFDQALEMWDVSQVANMGSMFAKASSFNHLKFAH